VIAFIAETVVGGHLGRCPAVPGYFKRVREICDRHGILLILDEVMCGLGSHRHLARLRQEGVSPDILTMQRDLGGGYAPIAAMLLLTGSSRLSGMALAPSSIATPIQAILSPVGSACRATVIRRDELLANIGCMGALLARRLQGAVR